MPRLNAAASASAPQPSPGVSDPEPLAPGDLPPALLGSLRALTHVLNHGAVVVLKHCADLEHRAELLTELAALLADATEQTTRAAHLDLATARS